MSDRTCPVIEDGVVCGKKTSNRQTMCHKHQSRKKVHGDPTVLLRPVTSWVETKAFFDAAASSNTDACIDWPWSVDAWGYGRYTSRRYSTQRANRAMCIEAHGPAPEDKPFACHTCHNPPCINPRHLYWGSAKDNYDDRVAAGRSMHNAGNPNSKLTWDDIPTIEALIADHFLTYEEIGALFDVGESVIRDIAYGRRWVR